MDDVATAQRASTLKAAVQAISRDAKQVHAEHKAIGLDVHLGKGKTAVMLLSKGEGSRRISDRSWLRNTPLVWCRT